MSEVNAESQLNPEQAETLVDMIESGGAEQILGGQTADRSGNESVRRYDFHQPDRFNKEHLRTLRMIHENMARRLGLQMSTKMRTSINVRMSIIETGPYATFVQLMAESPGALHMISAKPLPGRMLLQYDNRLADMLVDRLLGGVGTPRISEESRELTELEMDLLSAVTGDIMDAVQDTWQGTVQLNLKLDEMQTNPYFVQLALPSDTCAWIAFEVDFNGHAGSLHICIPASVLKPVTPKLSPQALMAGMDQQNDSEDLSAVRRHVRRHLEDLQIELTALLRGGELLFSELMALQTGDVIPLQRHISEKAVLTIQGNEKLEGHLGVHRGKISVAISQVLDERLVEIEEAIATP